MTASEVGKSRIESVMRACRILLRMSQARPDVKKSEILYYQMLAGYCERIVKARREGKFLAAHTVFFPTEILYAMDIVPMHTETTSWMTALFTGEYADLLAAGAELGLASEICSAHRGVPGAFKLGVIPRPDVILWSNLVCDNTAKCGELLMELNHSPGFFLDHPFQQTGEEEGYLVAELQDLISFLEEKSGHKMDRDRLSEMVARMDHQIELYREIEELRKAVPSPFPTHRILELYTTYYLFPGQPEAIEYLETLRDEIDEMVSNGKGAYPEEKFRLMSLFTPPMYLMGFLGRLSQERGAVGVCEPFFTHWREGRLDPARPLESIVKKSYMTPEVCSMYGLITEKTVKDIVDCATAYKVDGAVYYANACCRHTCATIKLFKDALNEVDVPMLTLDCDVVDPTFNTEDEMRQKLEQFFELLEDR